MKKKLLIRLLAAVMVVMTLVGTVPAMAATDGNSYHGYSIPKTLSLKVGETKSFTVTTPKNTKNVIDIQWQIHPSYLKIDCKNGFGSWHGQGSTIKVTGLKAGTSYLYATVIVYKDSKSRTPIEKMSLRTTVTVTAAAQAKSSVALKSISLNKTAASLKVGSSETLTVKYNPTNTTASKTVKWSSSNSAVASVDSKGKVTGKKAGTATITATVGTKTAKCTVTVKQETKSTSTGKQTASAAGYYLNVNEAYEKLNAFRREKNVWYWNQGSKTKTYFNTKTQNQLSALKRNAELERVAKLRAKELVTLFAHTRPNGTRCFTAYPAAYAMGENIARGQTTVTAVMNSWKEENKTYEYQGHRRAMLNSNYNSVGIACYVYKGQYYWVMCLAKM